MNGERQWENGEVIPVTKCKLFYFFFFFMIMVGKFVNHTAIYTQLLICCEHWKGMVIQQTPKFFRAFFLIFGIYEASLCALETGQSSWYWTWGWGISFQLFLLFHFFFFFFFFFFKIIFVYLKCVMCFLCFHRRCLWLADSLFENCFNYWINKQCYLQIVTICFAFSLPIFVLFRHVMKTVYGASFQ